MKETKTIEHIHEQVKAYAKEMLKEAGYTILPDLPDKTGPRRTDNFEGEKGFEVHMSIAGYSRRYDGWEYELTDADWEVIFSIGWDESTRQLFEYMKKSGNKNLTVLEVKKDTGIELALGGGHHDGTWINKELHRNRVPYHFGITHKEPIRKNSYPDMFRMFKRPVPIDGEEVEG
jgi:hypothetical protein